MFWGPPINPVSNESLEQLQTCQSIDQTIRTINNKASDAPSDYLIFETGLRTLLRCHSEEWKQSLELSRLAHQRHPTRGEIRLLTGELLAKHGYLSQAAVEFRAALTHAPWLWERSRVSIQHHLMKQPVLLFDAVSDNEQLRHGMFGYLMVNHHLDTAQAFLDAWKVSGLSIEETRHRQSLLCVRQQDQIVY